MFYFFWWRGAWLSDGSIIHHDLKLFCNVSLTNQKADFKIIQDFHLTTASMAMTGTKKQNTDTVLL